MIDKLKNTYDLQNQELQRMETIMNESKSNFYSKRISSPSHGQSMNDAEHYEHVHSSTRNENFKHHVDVESEDEQSEPTPIQKSNGSVKEIEPLKPVVSKDSKSKFYFYFYF